jgi:hypothetical protein
VHLRAHVPKIGKTSAHWLLEGLLIVVSVALGFAVAQYGESRQNRELAARALERLQTEIERNAATLEPQLAMHRKWLATLNGMDSPEGNGIGIDLFLAARPPMPPEVKTTFPILRHAAWDAALSTPRFG